MARRRKGSFKKYDYEEREMILRELELDYILNGNKFLQTLADEYDVAYETMQNWMKLVKSRIANHQSTQEHHDHVCQSIARYQLLFNAAFKDGDYKAALAVQKRIDEILKIFDIRPTLESNLAKLTDDILETIALGGGQGTSSSPESPQKLS